MNKATRRIKTAAILILTAVILTAGASLTACGGRSSEKTEVGIVATVFPAYDFVRTLVKDVPGVSVRLLLSPGTESHTYDPSVSDAVSVSDCDLFVYGGGDADPWVTKFLSSDRSLENRAVSMLEGAGRTLGIEGEHETDPHVWTSPVNAISIVRLLAAKLCSAVGEGTEKAAKIRENLEAFTAALEKLDGDFRSFAASVPEDKRVLAFGDRYPFRYFCAEYGFTAYAVFPGCAEESEPAASDVKKVVDTIRENDLKTVYFVELSNHRIADAIAAETGCRTAMLHSCHNLTKEDFDAGETYLTIMYRNLETLRNTVG